MSLMGVLEVVDYELRNESVGALRAFCRFLPALCFPHVFLFMALYSLYACLSVLPQKHYHHDYASVFDETISRVPVSSCRIQPCLCTKHSKHGSANNSIVRS